MTTVVPIDRGVRCRRGRAAHPAGRGGQSSRSGPGPSPGGPEPERLVLAVARAFLEVEAGLRPLSQLTPLLCPALDLRLSATIRDPNGRRPPVDAIRSVRCTRLPDGGFEAAVVVRRGERCGALVVRAERREGAWRIVEIARPEGEPGGPPSPAVQTLAALS